MTWFFYSVATYVLFSASNFVDKFVVSKKLPNPLLLTILGSWITGLIGLAIALVVGFKPLTLSEPAILVAAGIFLALYMVPYFQALKLDDASRAASMFQFIPIFSILLSAIFLNEFLTWKIFLGFVLIFTGGLILSLDKLDLKFFRPRPTLWYMLLSCFLYASANILYRFVARNQSFWPSLYFELIGMGLGGVILFLFYRGKRQFLSQIKGLRPVVSLLSLSESFSIPARIANAYAIALVPASYVVVVGDSQPLFLLTIGLILSRWFPKIIKEDISRQTIGKKLVNIALILAGLGLIYF